MKYIALKNPSPLEPDGNKSQVFVPKTLLHYLREYR
jgi:hypothetical protein